MLTCGRRYLIALAIITAVGACLRFYGLSKGAPYHHFHIDEHFVFLGADHLRDSMRKAAESQKFFMYGPLPMYLVNIVRSVYELVAGPLTLSSPDDGKTYMLLGRSVSALLGTATIPLVFFVANRAAGRVAGLVSAALLACAVLHLRDSHFFTVDITMVFCCVATWAAAVAVADRGRLSAYVVAGVGLGAAVASKYNAIFLVLLIITAHVCSPSTPRSLHPIAPWRGWALKGMAPLLVGAAVFLLLDPMVLLFFEKFRGDVSDQISGPLLGASQPLWNANFRDVQPQLYWFSNLLPWGIGPAFMIWGLAGIAWLLTRRTRLSLAVAAYPLAYYAVAGQTVTPFIRYSLPLLPGLAVAAGVLSGGLLNHPRWRRVGVIGTAIVLVATGAYAAAYMSIYRAPDIRLQASTLLTEMVPRGASIVVEPSHNTPPTGRYLAEPDFYKDYVPWGAHMIRTDQYVLYTLDVYRYLYDTTVPASEKRRYIERRLAAVDYILMDDTFVELYEHLSGPEYEVVRQYYHDLFNGRLGFQMVLHLKNTPSLFGLSIDDEHAEFTFTLFDHPQVFLFKRTQPKALVGSLSTPLIGLNGRPAPPAATP
jgi:hypothetical protein